MSPSGRGLNRLVRGRKSLAEKEAGVALRLLPLPVLQSSKGFIAKLRVEVSSAPAGGIQPSPMAASVRGFLFGQTHDFGPEALAAEVLRNPEILDEEPSIGRSADEPAQNRAFTIPGEDSERRIVARWNVLLQGIQKARLDLRREGFRIRLDGYADIRKAFIH